MADRLDQPYTYPTADEVSLEKHNAIVRAGFFRQQVGADMNFLLVGIRTGIALSEAQRRQLETAIEGIQGVQASKVLIFGVTPAAAEVPANYHVEAVGEMRFRLEPNPA